MSDSEIIPAAASGPHANGRPVPDPLANPEYYDGVLFKRVIGYWIDVVLILLLMGALFIPASFLGVLSLGVLWAPMMFMMALVPLFYHSYLIGSPRSATIGMRTMGVEVRVRDGGKPDFLRAAALTLLFYISVMLTSWLILLVPLFNREKRTLHDMVCDTIVVNVLPEPVSANS
jgi:uncharacterized RDD family membrane protein YckC